MPAKVLPFLIVMVVATLGAVGASAGDVPPNDTRIDVFADFVAAFGNGTASNAFEASAGAVQCSGGTLLPGIFLHPVAEGDAVLTFSRVPVPAVAGDDSPWLLFRMGFRDGIPWDDPRANGAQFEVRINGEPVFKERYSGVGWRACAVDLMSWAGQSVDVEFRTNAIDGNPNYDWCAFGEPRLVVFRGTARYTELPERAKGIALAEVRCAEPATVTLTIGDRSERAEVEAGTHVIPIHFDARAGLQLSPDKGVAEVVSVRAALYAPRLGVAGVELSTPLVTAGRPFNIILTLKNSGLGTYLGGDTFRLQAETASKPVSLGDGATKRVEADRMEPGTTRDYYWEGLVAPQPGEYQLTSPWRLSFHVFGAEPRTAFGASEDAGAAGIPRDKSRSAVATPWSQLRFVTDAAGYAYAIAEVASGDGWQRVGSLYPLANGAVPDKDGIVHVLQFRATRFDVSKGGAVVITLEAPGPDGTPWPAAVTFKPDLGAPRIHIQSELTAPADADLVAFCGPTVLAGDRAFGVRKDFAIFPGVEYLEGDEESSSVRDLAYPLSDRRVPAAYKVTTPLMAVQAQDALIALLWDANQEWSAGERYPAAQFLAPAAEGGSEYIHLSLFAPSVGKYVPENTYGAESTPYPLKRGERVTLSARLVLDHKVRYPADSVVNGPHKGGLVLQAIAQWWDAYGFPSPSAPPRDWDAERALCRQAYASAIWSEDPPGWKHCYGWDAGLFVGHAVPQMLDIRAGVSDAVRADVERRIGLVLDRALREEGAHYLWTNAGCHILAGELPFYYGYVAESMKDYREYGLNALASRENGQWVWRPSSEKHASLGKSGDHTLSQAAQPSFHALRAARLTGDRELTARALVAMKQMEQYEVPRGAQTWECPLYQPDILAAAQAIRAYCEAYRLTGDRAHIEQARYWAWTGLPFLYFWEADGYPTMRYNVISVIGSTFYTHSWIGLPVVWCGEVYAHALQDLAEFDDSLDWRRVAEGINCSTMWQQYAEGPSAGCYPDSWDMLKNRPNPADINPENILVNGFRLRGQSPEIRFARLPGGDGPVMLNSAADILKPEREPDGTVRFALRAAAGFPVYSMLAPVPEPSAVKGAGERVGDSGALQHVDTGWMYDAELRAVVFRHRMGGEAVACAVSW